MPEDFTVTPWEVTGNIDYDLLQKRFGTTPIDDALLLAEHGTLARIPLAVWSDSLPVLEAALRYYQGRLLIDSSSPLGEKVLGPIAEKYGGILY